MNIEPLNKHLVVEVSNEVLEERKTAGGLFIPQTVAKGGSEHLLQGVVIAIPKDSEYNEKEKRKVAKNDKVLFSKFEGTETIIEGRSIFLVKEDLIKAIVNYLPPKGGGL